MSTIDIAALRQEYMRARLDETDVKPDPIAQFQQWFDEAVQARLPMVNAMTLATVAPQLQPSARIVLLKGVDQRGFVFYTDYASRKGHELAANARAALLFYWIELEREVRIEGVTEKTSVRESDEYFATRPAGSRIAANASRQSSVVADRQTLETRYAEVERRHGEQASRPASWGGYRVLPETIEFWQGRANRLHDRLLYTKASDGTWRIARLAP
ncbi:MAG TPA: pyridoxamine 5'-phosphate oxidase [Burkholderiales bacterium]|nr:pyridoxamine 5'-phosphate oxidase [Burkholderiales bacterium]